MIRMLNIFYFLFCLVEQIFDASILFWISVGITLIYILFNFIWCSSLLFFVTISLSMQILDIGFASIDNSIFKSIVKFIYGGSYLPPAYFARLLFYQCKNLFSFFLVGIKNNCKNLNLHFFIIANTKTQQKKTIL